MEILWIIGAVVVVLIGITEGKKTQRTVEQKSWSDDKLKARQNYLLWHEPESKEYWEIETERDRRINERLKESSRAEWEKYK